MTQLVYRASPTMTKFHKSDALIRGMIGPYGSGKSTACIQEIAIRAAQQEPDHDGVRRTMCIIVRNTYKQIKTTTWRSIKRWFPVGVAGVFRSTENVFYLGGVDTKNGVQPGGWVLPDGTKVFCEIMFLALDTPDDEDRLLSLEPTFVYFNEFREINIRLVRAMIGRIGRFPAKPTFYGIWMDSNPPPLGGDYYNFFENYNHAKAVEMSKEYKLERVPEVQLFKQPGGMDPDAENLEFLPGGRGYYVNMLVGANDAGRDQGWIDAHVHGKYSYYSDAEGIFSKQFKSQIHELRGLRPTDDYSIIIGLDPGLNPACTFMQRDKFARWKVFGEIACDFDCDATEFDQLMREYIMERGWHDHSFLIYGDPAVAQRSAVDKSKSWESYLKSKGWAIRKGKYQKYEPRFNSVRSALNRLYMGQPGILIDPEQCPVLKRGLLGAYHRERTKNAAGNLREVPAKTYESHVTESLQYPISTLDWGYIQHKRQPRVPDQLDGVRFSDLMEGKARRKRGFKSNAGDWSAF